MNRSLTMIAALVLVACEGEPPKVPTGSPVTAPLEQTPEPEQDQAQGTQATNGATPPPAAGAGAVAVGADGGTVAMCPCACTCPGAASASGATAASADGGAATTAATPPAVAAAPPTTGRVVGTVTTVPAAQAANAIVWLEDAPVDPNAKKSAIVDNRMMNFIPFVTVIPVGGHVTFHNTDPFPHNVFSPDHERFDMGAIGQNGGRARIFNSPGAYTVLCNLHPNMLGYVVVTPSSYFARAGRGGAYAIKDVPNGTYHVTAWGPRQEPQTQTVTVNGGDATLDFNLHR